MALKIRLARGGAKKRPYYRIVVAEATSPRDGRFVEKIGTYNPLLEKEHEGRLKINEERAKYWMGTGAKTTDRVEKLFSEKGLMAKPAQPNNPKKAAPGKKAQERAAEKAAAEKEKAEAAAAAD